MLNKILISSKTVSQTALYRLSNNINVTEELCLIAVKQYWDALRYVPKHLRTEQICLIAVKQYGRALYYVPEHLRTEQLCLIAVKQTWKAFEFVPEKIRNKFIQSIRL